MSLLIFFCFPLIAFQLHGTKRGSLWILTFITLAILMYMLQLVELIPSWNDMFPSRMNVLLSGIAFVLITLLTYIGERQNEKEKSAIIQSILFDETTFLPNNKVLVHSIRDDVIYLFSILYIDNFRDLGLIFGYELSDDILCFMTKQLDQWKNIFNYTAYKLKGNEFGLLLRLDCYDRAEAHDKIARLRHLLQSAAMPCDNSELRFNIQFGGVMFHSGDRVASSDIFSKADLALKSSIENHRGFTLFENHEYVKNTAIDYSNLYSILYANYEKKKFKAFFQPVINASTGSIDWYESLLRIQNNENDYESPVRYLSIAESTGLDMHLTSFMLEEACSIVNYSDKNISVNITFKDMMRDEIIDLLIRHHGKPRTGKGKLILEILERSEMYEIDTCIKFLTTARELGCLIAIDDFGSGFSNFGSILSLPVDIVKINGTLVQQMRHSVIAKKMIKNIIIFCKDVGWLIAAEWVDTQELADELKELGVDYLQGFHYGQPVEGI